MTAAADSCGYKADGKVKGCGTNGRRDWEKRKGQARRPITKRNAEPFTCCHKVNTSLENLLDGQTETIDQSLTLNEECFSRT